MSKKSIKPIALAVSAAFATGMAATAQADENPFAMSTLASGYEMPAPDGHKGEEGKCGEGKCGEEGKKGEEGKCGEGKCGEGDKEEEGKKGEEGKCGEGKCGGAA